MKKKALVLSGGGARGAYQVGVLKALSEIAQEDKVDPQISIFTGISAGAINATFLAAHADDFHKGVEKLVQFWSQMTSDQVFSSNTSRMGKIAFTWMKELSLGPLTGTTPGRALLDTAPLNKLISDNLPFNKIQKNIDSKHLDAVAITATDYASSLSVTFVQGQPELSDWKKIKRVSRKTHLSSEHILASSSIPMLFPPVAVENSFYGDGCVRNSSPCMPAILLGADALFVIGVRQSGVTMDDQRHAKLERSPSVARVLNVLLNSVLLDGIEIDVDRIQRFNSLTEKIPEAARNSLIYRKLDTHFVCPSRDIGEIALKNANQLPSLLRYLMRGLGTLEDASEIISYLLFDPQFCQTLIQMGYEDGQKNRDQIAAFIS